MAMPMAAYRVLIIQEGYCNPVGDGCFDADCSITLLKGQFNILVDTGGPRDAQIVRDGLAKHGLDVQQVNYVVGTHGHLDHIGNLNLFPDATFIVSHDIYNGKVFLGHNFNEGPYKIDKDIEVMSTPGHTGRDVSVIVYNTHRGTTAVVGDLFECEADLTNDALWRDVSENPDQQEQSRQKLLALTDYIIPGHGPGFVTPKASG